MNSHAEGKDGRSSRGSGDGRLFKSTVESLFSGMDSFLTSKTVVGDAIHIGDTIIVPLVNVSFGVGAGAFAKEPDNTGAGGMGGKMTPAAVLVITNGTTRLINVDASSGIDKVLDMVPDLIGKVKNMKKGKNDSKQEDTEAVDIEKAVEETIIKAQELENEREG